MTCPLPYPTDEGSGEEGGKGLLSEAYSSLGNGWKSFSPRGNEKSVVSWEGAARKGVTSLMSPIQS